MCLKDWWPELNIFGRYNEGEYLADEADSDVSEEQED